MGNNTKILIIVFSLLIVLGFTTLWYSLGNKSVSTQNTLPARIQATSYPLRSEASPLSATSSGILVTKVIDGDTIEIEGGEKVRYLGVDTPETKDPRKPVQCFGKEASNRNKNLVEGKRVFLEKDVTETDKYNRLLRFVYLPLEDGTRLFVNDYLIREGYGHVLTIPPDVKYSEQFLDAQRKAREQKKGLWEKC